VDAQGKLQKMSMRSSNLCLQVIQIFALSLHREVWRCPREGNFPVTGLSVPWGALHPALLHEVQTHVSLGKDSVGTTVSSFNSVSLQCGGLVVFVILSRGLEFATIPVAETFSWCSPSGSSCMTSIRRTLDPLRRSWEMREPDKKGRSAP